MRITLCGRVVIEQPPSDAVELTRPQVQLCLAVLLAERHRGVEREAVADVLWPATLPDHWPGALRGVLAKLRRTFDRAGGADPIERTGNRLQLRSTMELDVDVERAAQGVRAAEESLRSGDARSALGSATEAVDLVAAPYLPEVDVPWANDRRTDVDHLRQRARRLLARSQLELGRPALANAVLDELLADDPLDDESQLLLARTLAAGGERLRAISALDAYAATLEADLGVGPGRDHLALRRDLANADVEDGPRPARVEADTAGATGRALPLFGRDAQRARLTERVLGPRTPADPGLRVVVVEGGPGIGKTALAESVAAEVSGAGHLVLWGTCSP